VVLLAHREIVFARVVLNVKLHRTIAVGAVSDDGLGDEAPTQGLSQEVRGIFPLVERAAGEVPEGYLSLARLVDGFDLLSVLSLEADEKRVVGAMRNQVTRNRLSCLQEQVSSG
jgi:hypothetical protein